KARLPVVPAAAREAAVATALQVDEAHGRHGVHERALERPQGLQETFAHVQGTDPRDIDADQPRSVFACEETGVEAQLIRARARELLVESQHRLGLREWPRDAAAQYGPDLVQPVFERGDHAEVGAAASHRPEEVGMLGGTGHEQTAAGVHHVDGHEVVAGEAVLAAEPSDATAEREPGDSGRGDDAGGRGEPEGLAVAVEIGQGEAWLGARDASARIDPAALHRREVDHEPALAHGLPGDVVATAPHRDLEALRPRELDAGHDVARTRAANDQGW